MKTSKYQPREKETRICPKSLGSQTEDQLAGMPGGYLEPEFYFGVEACLYYSVERYRHYVFRYVHDVESPGKIRVYVEEQPRYGFFQSRNPNIIHRWPGRNGAPPYICFKDECKPSSFQQAQKMAHIWADLTDEYIRTGVSISDQIARR